MTTHGQSSPVSASAPGSMMLMGEYAVLEGSRALLMTLPQRLTVQLSSAPHLQIDSDRWASFSTPLTHVITSSCPAHVRLITTLIHEAQKTFQMPQNLGFKIDIQSQLDPTLGFGSSGALCAALLKALAIHYQQPLHLPTLFHIGQHTIRTLYHYGSGADLIASLYDQPFCIADVHHHTAETAVLPWHVSALYVGYKTPTPDVLKHVYHTVPVQVRQDLMKKMTEIVDAFLATYDLQWIQAYQQALEALGVCCPRLHQALELVSPYCEAAKISGSGLGDCIVMLDHAPSTSFNTTSLPEGFIFFDAQRLMR